MPPKQASKKPSSRPSLVRWRYIGTESNPEQIRINGQTIRKGEVFKLPAGYDFTKEYGADLRIGFHLAPATARQNLNEPLNVARTGEDSPSEEPGLELRFHVKSEHLMSHQHLFLARMIEEASKREPRAEHKLQVIERRLTKHNYSIYDPPVLACLEDLDFFHSWVRRPTRTRKPQSPHLQIERVQKRIRPASPEKLLRQWRGRVAVPLLLAGKLRMRFPKDRPILDVLGELDAERDKLLIGHLNRFRNSIKGLTIGAAVERLEKESRRRLLRVEAVAKIAAHMRNAKVSFKTIDRQVATRLPPRIAKASMSEQGKYLGDLESRVVTEVLAACIEALIRGKRDVTPYHCANKVLKPMLDVFWPEYAEKAPVAALKRFYNSMRSRKM